MESSQSLCEILFVCFEGHGELVKPGEGGRDCSRQWPAGGRRRLLNSAWRNSAHQRTGLLKLHSQAFLNHSAEPDTISLLLELPSPFYSTFPFCFVSRNLTHVHVSTAHICMQEPSVYFLQSGWDLLYEYFSGHLDLEQPFNYSHLKALSHKTFCSG